MEQEIFNFYASFNEKNWREMVELYHDDIVFEDPAFGKLSGDRARNMWQMLISRGSNDTQITCTDVMKESENSCSAKWTAVYEYGPKKRKVINNITASFVFKDGKIVEHTDTFDVYRWSQQALGLPGYLFGWLPFWPDVLQKKTNKLLDKYIQKKS